MINNFTFFDIFKKIREAFRRGSYFISITSKDPEKIENDLDHIYFRKNFDKKEIILSFDSIISGMNFDDNKIVNPVIPQVIIENKKPLKIAIVTHFSRCPDSFSPGKAVKNLIKLLAKYGHTPVFFTLEGSKLSEEEVGCEIRRVVTKFKRQKNVINGEAKEKFKKVLKEQLVGFDLAISFDLLIDDCITYREAIKECKVDIEWLHFIRSGIGRPIDFSMLNARFVYLNYAETGYLAKKLNVNSNQIRTVFNEKDPSFFFRWNPITDCISTKMRLWEKDIIQIYPLCSTRLSAKCIDSVIKIFALMKNKFNKKVCLVICNSNANHRVAEIEEKIKFAKKCGLDETDILFTSTLKDFDIAGEVPNEVVSQLFQISNLFVFPSQAEVGPNVWLEAAMGKNLLVANSDLALMTDFFEEGQVLEYSFGSDKKLSYKGKDENSLEVLTRDIIKLIENNKVDRQFRFIWKQHNKEAIYKMLQNVLYERIDENNHIPTKEV